MLTDEGLPLASRATAVPAEKMADWALKSLIFPKFAEFIINLNDSPLRCSC
jgi:hypothetical protein